MSYLALKYLHLISMVLLFGTGLGSAFYKWMADRRGDPAHIATTNRHVVLADWLFTTPTIIIQPVTGILLANATGIALSTPWLIFSLLLYAVAGACWIPVVWLQLRMRDISLSAWQQNTALPDLYWHYARLWLWLGVPAFTAMLAIVYLMVFKSIPGVN
jgi:uncharacterized membrane protein